jgi:hypothetical protein
MAGVTFRDLLTAAPTADDYPELAPPKPGTLGHGLGVPRPAVADEAIPLQARVGSLLKTHAQAGSDWQALSGDARRIGVEPDKLRRQYELEVASEQVRGRDVGTYGTRFVKDVAGNLPWSPFNFFEAGWYKEAKERFEKGEATDRDIGIIANYEEQDRQRRAEGTGKGLLRQAGALPGMVIESVGAGKAIGAIGKAAGLSRAAQTAGTTESLLTRQGLLAAARGTPAEVAKTPFMPSMYLAQAQQRAIENGGEWHDLKNIGPTGAYAMLQVGVLGHMGRVGNAPGKSLLQRGAEKTGFAMGEQQAGDAAVSLASEFLPKDYALKETRYGSLAKLARGDEGGTKEFLGQLLTFAAFAGWSAKGGLKAPPPGEVLDAGVKAIDDAARQGQPKDAALAAGVEAARATVADVLPAEAKPDADPLAELTPDHLKMLAPALGVKTRAAVKDALGKLNPDARRQLVDAVLGRDPEVEAGQNVQPRTFEEPAPEQSVPPAQPDPAPEPVLESPEARPVAEPTPEAVPAAESAPARAPESQAGGLLLGDRAARDAAVAEAVRAGKAAVYVDMDIDNMAGLVGEVGEADAGRYVGEMLGVVREELAKVGAEVRLFRHAGDPKGDEHSALVVGADRPAVDRALLAARERIADLGAREGLSSLPHAKGGDRPAGVGITAFAEPIPPGADPRGVFTEAEAGTESRKGVPLEQLRRRLAASPAAPAKKGASLLRRSPAPPPDAAARLARLSERERQVAEARVLGGESFEEAGAGLGVTKQRAEQIEKEALRKVGAPEGRTLADAQKEEAAERLLDMAERTGFSDAGRRVAAVELGELRFTDEQARGLRVKIGKRRREIERAQGRIDSEVDAWIRRAESAKPEERAALDAEIAAEVARLEKEAAGRPDPAAGEPGPVRGVAAEEVAPAKKKAGASLRRKKVEPEPEPAPEPTPAADPVERQRLQQTRDYFERQRAEAQAELERAFPQAAKTGERPAFARGYDDRLRVVREYEEKVADIDAQLRALPAAEQPPAPEGFGKPLSDAERAGLAGGGQPDASDLARPLRESALANARIDEERRRLGLPAIMGPARLANAAVWDAAMARLDADPGLGARLVGELTKKPRATTVEENALLLHREIALKNEHERAMLRFVDAMRAKASPAELDLLDAREQELLAQVNEVHQVARTTGTEWGRAGQFRRQLAREDFTLAGMLRRATAAKGEPLTPAERVEVTAQFQKIDAAEKALEAAGGEDKATPDQRIAARKAKEAFAEKMAGHREARRPLVFRAARRVGDAANLARALVTSFDLSAVLRQGGFLTFAHPLRAARAVPGMLRSFASEAAFDRLQDSLGARPNAGLYDRAGLYLADRGNVVNQQEEAFMGRLTRKIPGVAGSQRAYAAFLNRLRADTFDAMTASLARNGNPTPDEAKAVANFVNAATGRGKLGKLEPAAGALANVFFSPRYFASRLQLLGGQPFYGGSAATRKMIAREYARTLAGVGVFYGLMALANDDESVETDPRSSDFGKVRLGKTRVDPLMGLSQPVVFGSRMVSGQSKSNQTGGVYDLRGNKPGRGHDAGDVILNFVRSKLAPVPGSAVNVVVGKDVTGEETTAAGVAGDLVVPMSLRDVREVMEEEGVPRGPALGLLSALGMGVQTYEKRR